jgi:hypothetical protein
MPKLTHEIRILIKCGAQENEKRLHHLCQLCLTLTREFAVQCSSRLLAIPFQVALQAQHSALHLRREAVLCATLLHRVEHYLTQPSHRDVAKKLLTRRGAALAWAISLGLLLSSSRGCGVCCVKGARSNCGWQGEATKDSGARHACGTCDSSRTDAHVDLTCGPVDVDADGLPVRENVGMRRSVRNSHQSHAANGCARRTALTRPSRRQQMRPCAQS